MSQLDLSNLFHALADLLDEGDEGIAAIGAAALRRHAAAQVSTSDKMLPTNGEIKDLLKEPNALSCCAHLWPIIDDLAWRHSGLDDGRITKDVALRMQTVELIGDHGMIHDDDCRVGLFAQTTNTDYVVRTHAAEELFVQIAGRAEWFKQGSPYAEKHPGDRMHHASNQPHASRSGDSAMIAVWVWAGDIGYETYKYTG